LGGCGGGAIDEGRHRGKGGVEVREWREGAGVKEGKEGCRSG